MTTTQEIQVPRDRGAPERDDGAIPAPGRPAVRIAHCVSDVHRAAGLVIEHLAWIETELGIAVFAVQPALVAELADLRQAYATPPSALFVADDGPSICATLGVRFHEDGSAELKRMYVQPAFRGRGHAVRLLRAALEHIERFGGAPVWLESIPGLMDPAIELYRRHGFRVADTRPYVAVDGAIVMTLDSDGGLP